MTTTSTRFDHVACLGCGCVCDDLTVTVRGARIASVANACPLGDAWFGKGLSSSAVLVDGSKALPNRAMERAKEILQSARAPLVYLGTDLTLEAYREAIAIADLLRARLDSPASDTVAGGILAAQVRGRAGATLGELVNRADLVLFWGIDPEECYPRFASRYALAPRGVATPRGRASRTVVSVDVGAARGPAEADLRVLLDPPVEIAAIGFLRALVQDRPVGALPSGLDGVPGLAERLRKAKYAALVHDAEPSSLPTNPLRAEALIALVQALNGPTRAVLVSLRAGGNRNAAEAVTTWQTGFPFGVDYSRGAPHYRPEESTATLLGRGLVDAVLLAGSPAGLPPGLADQLARVKVVAIGPGAASLGKVAVAMDTGTAGIHESGTAYRMDDVPLPLQSLIGEAREARATLAALCGVLPRRAAAG